MPLTLPISFRQAIATISQNITAFTAGRTRVFFVLLCGVLLLKLPFIAQQPVWDEAFSVFPAADFLAKHNFDFAKLLHQPLYAQGGPNTHSLTLITLLTAFVLWSTGGGKMAFIILHSVQFFLGALALLGTYELACLLFLHPLALLFTVTVGLMPIFVTQLGFMYLEIALAAAATWAIVAFARGRILAASALGVACCFIKESGILVAGALAIATILEQEKWSVRLRHAVKLVLPTLLATGLVLKWTSGVGATTDRKVSLIRICAQYAYGYFSRIPDLMIFATISFCVACVLLAQRAVGAVDVERPFMENSELRRALAACAALLILFHVFFLLCVPYVIQEYSFLPRYYNMVLPAVFLVLAYAVLQVKPNLLPAMLGCLSAFFVVNQSGTFYPRPLVNNIASLERSEEYIDQHFIQQKGVEALAYIPPEIPIFYALPDHFYTQYPVNGYLARKLDNGHAIPLTQDVQDIMHLQGNPCFYLYLNYPSLGGKYLYKLSMQLAADKSFAVENVDGLSLRDNFYKLLLVKSSHSQMAVSCNAAEAERKRRASLAGDAETH